MLAVTDAAIAAQNAVVAAESFGIGSCYIGDIMENCDIQRSLLHLPDYVFPAVMLVFGWPTQQQKDRVKPQRCAMEHIVHENGYTRLRSGPYVGGDFSDFGIYIVKQPGQVARDAVDHNTFYPFFNDFTNHG